MIASTPNLQRVATSAAQVLDPETVEEIAERFDGRLLGTVASAWLYAYSAALDLGFSEDTARRQAAAAWDANRGCDAGTTERLHGGAGRHYAFSGVPRLGGCDEQAAAVDVAEQYKATDDELIEWLAEAARDGWQRTREAQPREDPAAA